MSALPNELAKELLAALEGVPPGPYRAHAELVLQAAPEGSDGDPILARCTYFGDDSDQFLAYHFSRCSPENIRTLAEALIAETARAETLERYLATANRQLKAVDSELKWEETGEGRVSRIRRALEAEARADSLSVRLAEQARALAGLIERASAFLPLCDEDSGLHKAIAAARASIPTETAGT